MKTQKEKLIDILSVPIHPRIGVAYTEVVADYLMDNDVLPVVRGHWIEQGDEWVGVYYDCSACGNSWATIDGTPFENGMNYCPNCGADMRGDSDD